MDNLKLFEQSRLLWRPPNPSRTRVEAFRRFVNHKHGLRLKDYEDFHAYSVQDYTFWLDLWEFLGITSSIPPDPLRIVEPGRAPYLPNWFPGARLNYAENLLCRSDDGIAITFARENALDSGIDAKERSRRIQDVTWRELRKMVGQLTAGLRAEGVTIGDRVAAILMNSPIAVALALAVSAVGGILSPTAPDMGTQGILERYRQIRPRLLVAETSAIYTGKSMDLLPKLREVARALSDYDLKKVVLVPGAAATSTGIRDVPLSVTLDEFVASGLSYSGALTFEQLPFNQPLYILFSSGTSGPPKCIVHSAGGVLLQNKKDNALGFGMGVDDTYFQFTTTGWMMWPFMLAALAGGTRLIAYDGSPFYPDVKEFLKFVSEQRITVFGTSPRFLSELHSRGIHPLDLAPFDSLRILFSTGSVLTAPMFEWTQHAFGENVHVLSGSGGTDICGPFVGGVESRPVYSGEIQGKCLGMAVEIFDPEGRNIENTGTPGELVCTRPHPSLPVSFWNDNDGEKLRKAYFDTYPGVWRQGDFLALNPRTKGLMILGRSDGVLNPSGVRFGSAEIYAVLESPPPPYQFSQAIADALCVGQRRDRDKDERVLLFLLMRPGHRLTSELKRDIRESIKKALSARHVPAYIFEVDDIPYTVNSKKIEIAVKQIVSGSKLKPSGTVANPESLKQYYRFYEIELLDESGHPVTDQKAKPKL
ncbi:acetoacetyl-CoA synthetase [Fomitiporia mediterranea MF3/22]|uniref:acetoacetyl-CoA synthetase n=1 Tax=Fomitiporia mediterranea (strain MF3/22) TaxID=694068 RepID=UPI0004407C20|nr:acetoacetyl-CoA synthetase [Fomitiporia mediterranea MF3/22]EJD05262.1 acetoacetyl-CoA synthetase [Fomitiporia mediterranea MF3/22]